jgi:hypothetical protein
MWFGKRSNSGAVKAFCGQRPQAIPPYIPIGASKNALHPSGTQGSPSIQGWSLKSVILGIARAHAAAAAENDFEGAELLQAGQFGGTKVRIV